MPAVLVIGPTATQNSSFLPLWFRGPHTKEAACVYPTRRAQKNALKPFDQ